jgi:hypothetical protein
MKAIGTFRERIFAIAAPNEAMRNALHLLLGWEQGEFERWWKIRPGCCQGFGGIKKPSEKVRSQLRIR